MSPRNLLDSAMSAISFLREMAYNMIEAHPCQAKGSDRYSCHCPTCEMEHAMAVTSGWEKI